MNDKDIQNKLDKLKDAYRVKLYKTLNSLYSKISNDRSSLSQLLEIKKDIHTLSGTSGSFGFKEIGSICKKIELLIETVNDENFETVKDSVLDSLSSCIKLLSVDDVEVGNKQDVEFTETQAKSVFEITILSNDGSLRDNIVKDIGVLGYRFSIMIPEAFSAHTNKDFYCDLIITTLNEASTLNLHDYCTHLLVYDEEDSFESRLRSVRTGADGYLVKPYSIESLLDKLSEYTKFIYDSPLRVLIMDDDTFLSEYYKTVLESKGMEVLTVSDPSLLLGEVEKFMPELILMDLEISEIKGYELAAMLRQFHKWLGLPILYLSSESNPDRQTNALRYGADGFLVKPISNNMLLSSVKIKAARFRKIADLIHLDSLTGLLKPTKFKEESQQILNRNLRNPHSISLVMLDIDNFKSVNDTHGHLVGDAVIKGLSFLIKKNFRSTDLLCRYGGEEFSLLLFQCDIENAIKRLSSLLKQFSQINFLDSKDSLYCTFSAGVAEVHSCNNMNNIDDYLELADIKLYQAKEAGRNQIKS